MNDYVAPSAEKKGAPTGVSAPVLDDAMDYSAPKSDKLVLSDDDIIAEKAVVIAPDTCCTAVFIDYLTGVLSYYLNACLPGGVYQAVCDIICVIRHRENTVATLCFEPDTQHLKKRHSILRGESTEG